MSGKMMANQSREDIHNLIKLEAPAELKFPMYHSRFSDKVRREVLQLKECHRTMGFAEIPLEPPDRFLKKKTRIVRRPCIDKSKPDLPLKDKTPRFSKLTAEDLLDDNRNLKNFRKENIIQVMRTQTKHPVPRVADTKTGDCQNLELSGLHPVYTTSKGYGKTPKYIKKRKEEAGKSEHDFKQQEEVNKKPTLQYISEEEREKLLDGLKKNWAQLQKEFQLLPMITDTTPKIKRKSNLEKQLKQLEKDIDIVERYPHIYVCPDDECEV